MSILGSVLKVSGTIIEGTGKIIVNCVETIEEDNKKYRETEQYKRSVAEREEYIKSIKGSWNKILDNLKVNE